MRAIGLTAAAIIPAALAVAMLAYPVAGPSEKIAAGPTDTARSLREYVPPPHVRVIPIYGAVTMGR